MTCTGEATPAKNMQDGTVLLLRYETVEVLPPGRLPGEHVLLGGGPVADPGHAAGRD